MKNKAKLSLVLSMLIFGTIGLFRRWVGLPSGFLAMIRGLLGSLFLYGFTILKREKLNWEKVKPFIKEIILSGIFLGLNWMLLFEAYQYTSIASATLVYSMAPILVIVVSAVLHEEKLSRMKVIQCSCAFLGMILISGINHSQSMNVEIKGVGLGLMAAVFYAGVMLKNRRMPTGSSYEKTIVQLLSAGLVLLPYVFYKEGLIIENLNCHSFWLTMMMAFVHTGLAYMLYFDSIGKIDSSSVALISYFDPMTAVILSAFFLKEQYGIMEFIGTLLILGTALMAEINKRNEE